MGYCLGVKAALGIPKKFSLTHHELCRIRSATSSAGRVTPFCTRQGLFFIHAIATLAGASALKKLI
jgi:hypothetical protein